MDNNYFRYLNQKCPICKNEFTGNDNIVVCPLCGTPHHKECYKKNGECGNFDLHREGYRWTPDPVAQPVGTPDAENSTDNGSVPPNSNPFPPFYGNAPYSSENASSTVFFANQANPLSLFPEEIAEGVKTEEAAEFVQASSFKYIQKFFYEKSDKKTFNWAAFFFAPFWFFYRKLYKVGAIFLAVFFSISLVVNFAPPIVRLSKAITDYETKYESVDETMSDEETDEFLEQMSADLKTVFSNNKLGSALLVILSLFEFWLKLHIGFNANNWYYEFTVNEIRRGKDLTTDINQQKLFYYKNGGVSLGVTVLVILGNSVLLNLISILFF